MNATTPEKLTAVGVFDRLLDYASTPWRAAVVLVLVALVGAGYLLYLERARIADAVLQSSLFTPRLDVARFVRDAGALLRDTRGDAVILLELRLADNIAIDRAGFDRDGHPYLPVPGPQLAISPAGNMATLVRFLRNEVVCLDTAQSPIDEARALLAAGYVRACAVEVPPVLGVGVGALLIAWKTTPPPSAETRAGLVMTQAAMTFASW